MMEANRRQSLILYRCSWFQIADAATTDRHFKEVWRLFLSGFDDAAYARIEVDQEQGLIPKFDARSIQNALRALYLTHY
jgi:hypothetical protein